MTSTAVLHLSTSFVYSALGLSSLGRAESHALASIPAVLERLGAAPAPKAEEGLSFKQGRKLLENHTEALFGAPPAKRLRSARA